MTNEESIAALFQTVQQLIIEHRKLETIVQFLLIRHDREDSQFVERLSPEQWERLASQIKMDLEIAVAGDRAADV